MSNKTREQIKDLSVRMQELANQYGPIKIILQKQPQRSEVRLIDHRNMSRELIQSMNGVFMVDYDSNFTTSVGKSFKTGES
jgi:hypothetical protein